MPWLSSGKRKQKKNKTSEALEGEEAKQEEEEEELEGEEARGGGGGGGGNERGSGDGEVKEEALLQIHGAIAHLIDAEHSAHLATGLFSLILLTAHHGSHPPIQTILVTIGEHLAFPLSERAMSTKLDPTHYFFTLHIPPEMEEDSTSSAEGSVTQEEDQRYDSSLLHYGLTFMNPEELPMLTLLDKYLEEYSIFSEPRMVVTSEEEKRENLEEEASVPSRNDGITKVAITASYPKGDPVVAVSSSKDKECHFFAASSCEEEKGHHFVATSGPNDKRKEQLVAASCPKYEGKGHSIAASLRIEEEEPHLVAVSYLNDKGKEHLVAATPCPKDKGKKPFVGAWSFPREEDHHLMATSCPKDKGKEHLLATSCSKGKGKERHVSTSCPEGIGKQHLVASSCPKEEEETLVEEKSAAYWTTLAPNVEDYSSSVAKGIAIQTGYVIKGIFWCSDTTTQQLEQLGEYAKSRIRANDKPSYISPRTLRNLRRVRKVSKATERLAKGVLAGVITMTSFVSGTAIKSKVGKKLFKLLPGEVALVSLDAFGKMFDAVESAGKNVLNSTRVVTTGVVEHKYGEQAGEAADEGLKAAGYVMGTAWTVVKIRKAFDPKKDSNKVSKKDQVKKLSKKDK